MYIYIYIYCIYSVVQAIASEMVELVQQIGKPCSRKTHPFSRLKNLNNCFSSLIATAVAAVLEIGSCSTKRKECGRK